MTPDEIRDEICGSLLRALSFRINPFQLMYGGVRILEQSPTYIRIDVGVVYSWEGNPQAQCGSLPYEIPFSIVDGGERAVPQILKGFDIPPGKDKTSPNWLNWNRLVTELQKEGSGDPMVIGKHLFIWEEEAERRAQRNTGSRSQSRLSS